jgi:acyl-CoA-binding protein
MWDRNPSFKSTHSGSSQDESKPLKGSKGKTGGLNKKPFVKKAAAKDEPIQLATFAFACFVALCAFALIAESLFPTQSEEFLAFSQLGYQCWYPSLFAFVCVLCFLGVCGVVVAVVACVGASKLQKPLLKAVMGSAIALGFILLAVAAAFYYYGQLAKPDVVRVANLICQDQTVWCTANTTALTTEAPEPLRRIAGSRRSDWQGSPQRGLGITMEGSVGATAARRLGMSFGEAAIDYDKMLNDLGPEMPCDRVQAMCKIPPHFDPFRACMCSGQWDYSGHIPTSTSVATTTAAPVVATSAADTPESDSDAAASNTTGSSNTTQRRLAQASNLAPNAPGPWYGSIGAYCANWDALPSGQEWCFVYDSAQCSSTLVTPRNTSDGRAYFSSNGPCGSAVDSRSEFILDGLNEILKPVIIAVALGVLLLMLSCLAVAMGKVEPAKIDSGKEGEKKVVEEHHTLSLEAQFAKAQRMAVQKLRDQTPEAQKFELYGYYKQAKEGRAGLGSKPTGMMTKRQEREKWDAWNRVSDLQREKAMEGYIAAVLRLE